MPSLPTSNARVLVTGASGYLGSWTCHTLLQRGYSVRAAVHSDAEGQFLHNRYIPFTPSKTFEYVLLPDIQLAGACDEIVKGVDAIIHHAANVTFPNGDPSLAIGSAVLGTTGLLESATKHGKSVKRIVMTSSATALVEPRGPNHIWDENDYNNFSIQEVQKRGANSHPELKYCAAKTLAEQSTKEFMQRNQKDVSFDITTFCPPYIFGPFIHNISSKDQLGASLQYFLRNIQNPPQESSDLLSSAHAAVDVRDVAAAHVDALSTDAAANERFVITGGGHSWQDALDAVHYYSPVIGIPIGEPDAIRPTLVQPLFSTAKATRLLPTTFRPLAETFRDTMQPMIERGWWKTYSYSRTPSPLAEEDAKDYIGVHKL